MPIQIKPTQFNKRAEEIHSFLQECIYFDMIIVGQLFDTTTNIHSQNKLIIEQKYLSSNKHDSGIKLDITPYTLNVLSKPKVLLELANTPKKIISQH